MNTPNKLTILRILLVPIMVILSFFEIPGKVLWVPMTMFLMDIVFVIASITDKLDGTSKVEYDKFLSSSSKKAAGILKEFIKKYINK